MDHFETDQFETVTTVKFSLTISSSKSCKIESKQSQNGKWQNRNAKWQIGPTRKTAKRQNCQNGKRRNGKMQDRKTQNGQNGPLWSTNFQAILDLQAKFRNLQLKVTPTLFRHLQLVANVHVLVKGDWAHARRIWCEVVIPNIILAVRILLRAFRSFHRSTKAGLSTGGVGNLGV